MNTVSRTNYTLSNGKWLVSYKTTKEIEVATSLMNDLIAKKLHNCGYISRITDICNYNGTRTITVYYKHENSSVKTKSVYIVNNI